MSTGRPKRPWRSRTAENLTTEAYFLAFPNLDGPNLDGDVDVAVRPVVAAGNAAEQPHLGDSERGELAFQRPQQRRGPRLCGRTERLHCGDCVHGGLLDTKAIIPLRWRNPPL